MRIPPVNLVLCLCITLCITSVPGEHSGYKDDRRNPEEKIENEAKPRRDGLKVLLDKLNDIEDLIAGQMVSWGEEEEEGARAEKERCQDRSRGGETYGPLIQSLVDAFQAEKHVNRRVQRHVSDLEADMGYLKGAIMGLTREIKEELKMLNLLVTGDIKNKMDTTIQQSLGMFDMLTDLDKKVNEILQVVDNRQVKSKSCEELLNNGFTTSGLYAIYPADRTIPLQVYCDQVTDGGGWIVFQRREDGSENFYRNWIDYKFGFGNIEGEFWLGNEYLHILTHSVCDSLRVDLEDFENNPRFAKYAKFSIGSKATKYTLIVNGYTGDAGDSFSGHNGYAFSTKDRDNDIYGGSCSTNHKGAWWYSKCHASNLNGYYYVGKHDSYADGVNWYAWRGHHYSLKMTEMKCR